MTDITITLQAQLIHAQSLEQHLRTRCMVLIQQLIDGEAALKAAIDNHAAQDTELKAQIAGLQDELRQARQTSVTRKDPADGE